MNKLSTHLLNFALISLLPALYGCQGGGSGASFLDGSTFTPAATTGVVETTSTGGTESVIAMTHNPEPATMLLLGGGLAAMAFYRKKNR